MKSRVIPPPPEGLTQEQQLIHDNEVIRAIFDLLLSIGMNPHCDKTGWESEFVLKFNPSDDDYETNNKNIDKLTGFLISAEVCLSDLKQRRKYALLTTHPDKLASQSPRVRECASQLTSTIVLAFDEMFRRIALAKTNALTSRRPQFLQIKFQEFGETLINFLIHRLGLHLVVTNVSNSLYSNVGQFMSPPISPNLEVGEYFLARLFQDPEYQSMTLYELLCEVTGLEDLPDGFRVLIGANNIPRGWDDWLKDQLEDIRSRGISIEVYLLVTCDLYPSKFPHPLKFWTSPALGRILAPFIKEVLLMEPPCKMLIQIRSGALTITKKPLVIRYSTALFDHSDEIFVAGRNVCISWQESPILPFQDGEKFIIDFPASHEAAFLSLSQRIVNDANTSSPGLRAIPPRFTARSLADEGRDKKRKSITIICQGSDPECFAALYRAIREQYASFPVPPLMGWASLYSEEEFRYLLGFQDTDSLVSSGLFTRFIAQCVPVSKGKILFLLHPSRDIRGFIQEIVQYNSGRDMGKILRVEDSDGLLLWRDDARRAYLAPEVSRSGDMPDPLPHDLVLRISNFIPETYEALCKAFFGGAISTLPARGFSINPPPQLWFRNEFGKPNSRVLITSPTENVARAFFYSFREFQWNGTSGDSVTVTLYNEKFQGELTDNPSLVAVALRGLTLEESKLISSGHISAVTASIKPLSWLRSCGPTGQAPPIIVGGQQHQSAWVAGSQCSSAWDIFSTTATIPSSPPQRRKRRVAPSSLSNGGQDEPMPTFVQCLDLPNDYSPPLSPSTAAPDTPASALSSENTNQSRQDDAVSVDSDHV